MATCTRLSVATIIFLIVHCALSYRIMYLVLMLDVCDLQSYSAREFSVYLLLGSLRVCLLSMVIASGLKPSSLCVEC